MDASTDQLPNTAGLAQGLADFNLVAAPGHLLRRNHQRSYELFTKRVGDSMTRQQFALLITLVQQPGSSQNELVAATGMDKSTLKEMLGRMIIRGWVERQRDPTDSRAWAMRATSEGKALLAELLPRVAAAQRDILAPLDEADRVVFLRCLQTLLGLSAD